MELSKNFSSEDVNIQVHVVLGSWSSGSTALAGYLDRLAFYSCPPHQMTNDPKTPNSYEPKALRDTLTQCIDEFTLQRLQASSIFEVWFTQWIHQEKKKAHHLGYKHIVLKHPLMAFLFKKFGKYVIRIF